MPFMLGLVSIPSRKQAMLGQGISTELSRILAPYSSLTQVDPYPVPLNAAMVKQVIEMGTDPALVHDTLLLEDPERAKAMTAEDLAAECEDRLDCTLREFVERFGKHWRGHQLQILNGDVVTMLTENPEGKFESWSQQLATVPFGGRAWADYFPEPYYEAHVILANVEAFKFPEYDRAQFNENLLKVKVDVWSTGMVNHRLEQGYTAEEIAEMGIDPTHTEPTYLKSLICDYTFPPVIIDIEGHWWSRYEQDSIGNWLPKDGITTEYWNETVSRLLAEDPVALIVPVEFTVL